MAAPGLLQRVTPAGTALLLTGGALAVHGYHPYSEDGGVYVAGVEKLLNPQLFQRWPEFVTEHLRFSLFAPLTAALVRGTHLSLPAVLLLLYLLSTLALLCAGYQLAARLTPSRDGRLGAMTLLACWLPLPIAGTSLLLADPYMTARSLSTPLLLFSLCFALDALHCPNQHGRPRRWLACAVTAACAAVLHPLMAAYGIAAILLAAAAAVPGRRHRLGWFAVLAVLAVMTAAVLQVYAPAESAAYLPLALTRYYWFPAQWHLYEQLGLLAPPVVLVLLLRRSERAPAATLLRAAIALAGISLLVALPFSRASLPVHLVARLQPLRAFQTVYVVMIVALGAWAGQRLAALRPPVRVSLTASLLLLLSGLMFFVARDTYADSDQIEWPWTAPGNAWEQAFVWVREHTPQAAVVALDAHYITQGPGEDAQSFRAIAQRSTPPDYSKDGGVASLDPGLTAEWTVGERLTENLEDANDAERLRRLQQLGASWLVLEVSSRTAWNCPHRNATVKVCQVPEH